MHFLSSAVAVLLAGTPGLPQQSADSIRVPEVRTSGTAERSVDPDLATVSVQFSATGATPAEAGSHLAVRADSLRRALATLGIPGDSLVNRGRWYWWGNRVEIIQRTKCVPRTAPRPGDPWCDQVPDTSYRANDRVEIRIHDLKRLGAVMDTLLGRGLTDISEIQFSAGDVTAARDQAVRAATTQARAQAEAVAASSGMQLGRVLLLTTQPDYADRSAIIMDGMSVRGASVASGTVVMRPSIPVAVTVYGRWELIPKP
ncbi:MAG TPA: SIMPL domain-containing protein [Gemmatimonadales bacterium]|nr:SIMPL domain-containing protein [Gemmatimonadales bacterium]